MTRSRTALQSLGLVSSLLLAGPAALGATQITSIGFKGTSDPSTVEIRSDAPLAYEKTENAQDNQIVLDIRGAELAKAALRKIDTSSFDSKVKLISPYQVKDQPETVRIVVQLRGAATADVSQDGNLLKLSVGGSAGQAGETSSAAEPASPSAAAAPAGDAGGPDPAAVSAAAPAAGGLDEFMATKETRKFSGRPITLHVRDVDAADVFRLIGEASGFNIILGDDVKGKITLSMTDVPWDQALDVVLHTLRLGVERNNNILRVVTLANLTTEKQEELKAKRASEASTPRVTRVFSISYANLTDLQGILTKFAASIGAGEGEAAVVQLDNRTNSIIVRDLPDNIERMKRLIEMLDTQTPQVLIEAKVVEATEGFSKTLSGSLGVGGRGTNQFFASFAGSNPVDRLIGDPGMFKEGLDISKATSASGAFGVSPSMSFIPGVERLNAILNLGESENQVKVVSSPKTVVLNKEKASIVQGTPVLVPGTTVVEGVGTVPTTSVQTANLSLDVKPSVTNDGGVLMDLKVARDIPFTLAGGNGAVANRNMNTIVLVESGSTLVIGGIYTMTTTRASSGFPILRKIPILGALFGSESEGTDRSELFIFITPRILNPREAGLSG